MIGYNKRKYISFILLAMLILSMVSFGTDRALAAKKSKIESTKKAKTASSKKTKATASATKSKTSSSKKTKSKPSSKSKKVTSGKFVSKLEEELVLGPGVIYQNLMVGYGNRLHSIHVLEADLTNPECSVAVKKAHGLNTELERLQNMIERDDTTSTNEIAGGVNANFWSAYNNYPIGPTMINGELIEMKTHKRWSSTLFDSLSRPYIDNFYINGTIYNSRYRMMFEISNVNRRRDSNGVIVYNKYFGDTIPALPKNKLKKAFEEALDRASNEFINDSTETPLDSAALQYEIKNAERAINLEYSFPKVTMIYLDKPALNKDVRCLVKRIDMGTVAIPHGGCVISLGIDTDQKNYPSIGDTLIVSFNTNVYDDVEFVQAVSGTPRLVREGVASHEAMTEGSHGRRFLNKTLPRTAIGTDEARSKVFLVTVEPNNHGQIGANLKQWADIMKYVGAYNAMNLDGGGSSMMVIRGKNVMSRGNPYGGRRISVGLTITNPKKRNNAGNINSGNSTGLTGK